MLSKNEKIHWKNKQKNTEIKEMKIVLIPEFKVFLKFWDDETNKWYTVKYVQFQNQGLAIIETL